MATIKPEKHVLFQFDCRVFSQAGLDEHRQKGQLLEIVSNHII